MDYSALQIKVQNQIDKFGVTMVVRTIDQRAYNPVTDSHPEIVDEYPVRVLIEAFNTRDIDGSVIQVGDKKLLVPVLDSTAATLPRLDVEDKVEIEYDGRVWNPISVVPLCPAGVPVLYTIHVRG